MGSFWIFPVIGTIYELVNTFEVCNGNFPFICLWIRNSFLATFSNIEWNIYHAPPCWQSRAWRARNVQKTFQRCCIKWHLIIIFMNHFLSPNEIVLSLWNDLINSQKLTTAVCFAANATGKLQKKIVWWFFKKKKVLLWIKIRLLLWFKKLGAQQKFHFRKLS